MGIIPASGIALCSRAPQSLIKYVRTLTIPGTKLLQGWWRGRLEAMRLALAEVEKSSGLGLLCILGALVGAICGAVVLGLVWLIDSLQALTFSEYGKGFKALPMDLRFGLPIAGAALLGLVFQLLKRDNREGGVVHIIERLVYYQGYLPLRTALVQFFSAAVAIASGQSVGREGVAAHIGATAGSVFGHRLELPNNSVRTLIGCGTAAGIAASFNTPLGGVIFAMEVVMMEYSIVSFAPIILAAVSATAVAHLVVDAQPSLDVTATQLNSLFELPYLVFCGVVVGLTSAGFTRMVALTTVLFDKFEIWHRMVAAGFVTALAAAAFPQIMGVGFDTINIALAGGFGLFLALGIVTAKFIATSAATAASMPGGVVLPGFVIGSALGAALGIIGNLAAPGYASPPGFYALMGIGAMIGAMLQAPLTALVILLELSGSTELLLPAMLAVITAIVVARRVDAAESVFRMLLRRRGLEYRNDPVSQYLRRISVTAAMSRRFKIVERKLKSAELREILAQKPDWLMMREGAERAVLLRPADALRFLNQEENKTLETVDLMNLPGQRLEATPIHMRASLQEAYDALAKPDTEALYVERRGVAGQQVAHGIITSQIIEGAYQP